MAYNKRNKYKRIIEIQDIYLQYAEEGVTAVFIYEKYIKPKYHISQRTFESYLGIPAKLELKRLDDAKNNDDQRPTQGQLDF